MLEISTIQDLSLTNQKETMEELNLSNNDLSVRDILKTYISKANSIPSLEEKEENSFALDYFVNKNMFAAKKLIESHLKLVVKISMKYKAFGLSLIDVISEGNIGLMKAVEKFNPHAGFRLSTYATYWIKSNIQEYVLKSWSLVKIGTTALQKKLFYSLARLKSKITQKENRAFLDSDYKTIAIELGATENEVREMDTRLNGSDISLNLPVAKGDFNSKEAIDYLQDPSLDPESKMILDLDLKIKQNLLETALKTLNERERKIFVARKMLDEQKSLDELSKVFTVSKERIRQIELNAFEKIKKFILQAVNSSGQQGLLV